MSGCGSNKPGAPGAAAGSGAPAAGAVGPCPLAQSSILIIDELGIPLANATVQVTQGGATSPGTTDANGFLCFSSPPGTALQIQVDEIHEIGPGDSTSTASGQHFSANGTGP
jgi:hypothetical protein